MGLFRCLSLIELFSAVIHLLLYSVVGQSVGVYASSSSMQPLACAEIELVKANDPADTDVIVAFPETNDFER